MFIPPNIQKKESLDYYYIPLDPRLSIKKVSLPNLNTEEMDKFYFIHQIDFTMAEFESMKAGEAIENRRNAVSLIIRGKYRNSPAFLWEFSGGKRFGLPINPLKPRDEMLFNNAVVRSLEEYHLGDLSCDMMILGYSYDNYQIIANFLVLVENFQQKGKEVSIIHAGTEYSTKFVKVQNIKASRNEILTNPQQYDPLSASIILSANIGIHLEE